MQPIFQTDKIFASLVKEINQAIHEEVIITNEKGIILASTDQNRVGRLHEGAFLAMKNRKKMIMTQELTNSLKGVKEGIVLPIIIDKKPFAVIGITGNPKKVEPYGQIVQKMAELFIKGTIDQMTQEKIARNMELFIFDWINGTLPKNILKERGEFFNIELEKYSQIISIRFPFTTNDLSYKDILLLRNYWDQKEGAIFVRWGQGKLIIVDKKYDQKKLRIKLKSFYKILQEQISKDVFIGIGQPYEYTNLSTSFEQAERACSIANEEKNIIFEEELKFEMIQYELDKETKLEFVDRTLGPLQDDEISLNTLNSWFENNMSIQDTSKLLHIHKNTLYYRLEKIESTTKMNLKKLDDLMLLYIGNRFYQSLE